MTKYLNLSLVKLLDTSMYRGVHGRRAKDSKKSIWRTAKARSSPICY